MQRIVLILILTAAFSLSYGRQEPRPAAGDLISLQLDSVSFDAFIQELEQQTEYAFFYDPRWTRALKLSIHVDKRRLEEILDAVLADHELYYFVDKNKRVFITLSSPILSSLHSDSVRLQGPERLTASNNLIGDYVDTTRLSSVTIESKVFQFGNPFSALPGEKILTGYIRSINTGEPVVNATVSIDGQMTAVQADAKGYYSIAIPNEHATIRISSVGKSETRRQVLMYDNGRLDIEMDDIVYALTEVVVSAELGQNLRRTTMGVEKISIQAIKQTPAVLGEADVVKIVLSLPGVQTVSEASGGFNVRGGASDQNLVLFNDATVFNPSHFFGFFSSFNADVVSNVELYKSSIPARYGGRLSSVLDISAKTGTKNKISGAGGIGLLTGRMTLEGPIGEHTTFVVGGRSTYSDWLLNLIPDDRYKNSSAGFYDGNIMINSQLTEKDAISVMGYYSQDQFSLNTDTTYNYHNQNMNLRWNRIHSSRLYSVLTLGYDGYGNGILGRGNELHAFDWNFSLEQIYGRLDFNYRLSQAHNLSFGLHTQRISSSPGVRSPVGSASLLVADALPREQALESSLYISDHIVINDRLGLDLGLRYTLYQYLGPHAKRVYADELSRTTDNLVAVEEIAAGKTVHAYHSPEIRLGLRYALDDFSSIKAGYNSLNQHIHMLSNTTAITPTDTWKLSDNNIKPQKGDQMAIGYYLNSADNRIETSIEAYYKRIDDYLDYKSGAQLMMNHHIETDVINTKARAYGVEMLIKKNTGKLNGWISYAYSKAEQRTVGGAPQDRINRGAFYPSNHDKPHNFNLVGNYRVSHRFSVSLTTDYSTGRPITLPVGEFDFAGSTRVIYSDRNQYRIPDYFRMDLSLNIEGNHKVRKLAHSSWSVGVYNLTGRKNPFSVYYVSRGGSVSGYSLSVFGNQIPFVTYNFKF